MPLRLPRAFCTKHASTHAASRSEDADAASGSEPTWEKSGDSGDVLLVVPLTATAHVQSARLQGSSLMRSLKVIDVLVIDVHDGENYTVIFLLLVRATKILKLRSN